jgi:hypothetical protein
MIKIHFLPNAILITILLLFCANSQSQEPSSIFQIKDIEVKKKLGGDSVKTKSNDLRNGKQTTLEILNNTTPVQLIEITTLKSENRKLHTLELNDKKTGKNKKISVEGSKVSVIGDMSKNEVDRFGSTILSSFNRLDKNKNPTGIFDLQVVEKGEKVNPAGCIYWSTVMALTCGTVNPVCVVAAGATACHCSTDLCD